MPPVAGSPVLGRTVACRSAVFHGCEPRDRHRAAGTVGGLRAALQIAPLALVVSRWQKAASTVRAARRCSSHRSRSGGLLVAPVAIPVDFREGVAACANRQER
jgi:hypothetical protein